MTNLQKELESLEEMYNKGLMNTEEYNHMVNEIKRNIQEEPKSPSPPLITAAPIITVKTEIKPPPPPPDPRIEKQRRADEEAHIRHMDEKRSLEIDEAFKSAGQSIKEAEKLLSMYRKK